jgi:hypothetical protein
MQTESQCPVGLEINILDTYLVLSIDGLCHSCPSRLVAVGLAVASSLTLIGARNSHYRVPH